MTTVEPRDLDLGLLALFVGYAAQDRVLADLAGAGHGDLRPSHGFIVQHLLQAPRTATELAELQGVSVQAISKTVAEMVTLGYVESQPDETDRRQRRIALTERGHDSVAASRAARQKVQRRLRRRLGDERLADVTAALGEALDLLGGTDAVRGRRVRRPT